MDQQSPLRHRIGFVLAPNMLTTGTALPYEMWLAAADIGRARRQSPAVELLLTASGGHARGRVGRLGISAECELERCPPLDVIYLPALWRNPRTTIAAMAPLGEWLRRQHNRGATIAAVSTGVSLLAMSGLLDGRAATTHWYYFDDFERTYPRVNLKRDHFITQSGALYCAASINSLADVTVYLIERAFGRAIAQHVERNFSHEIRRTYEEYRYLDGGNVRHADELIVEAQLWMEANLSARVSVAELARRLRVSTRTLDRRFRTATGQPPLRYWQSRRMRLAKELLERTNLAIGDIAYRVGYQDPAYFSVLFKREMSVSPLEYRKTVRAKLFNAATADPLSRKLTSADKENSLEISDA